jgi:hypothetical protein
MTQVERAATRGRESPPEIERSLYLERDELKLSRFGIHESGEGLIQDAGWSGGQHAMGRPYSIDLRERAVAAVEKGGMSRRRAAAQFGWASIR